MSEFSNKTLAKNTVLMYIRMLFIMVVSLYTSRVTLQILGISDFGLYSLINGIIISFSFVNSALTSTAQRYLAIAIGKNDKKEYEKVFSTCTTLFIVSGVIMTIILIPIGLWLINNMFVIPEGRKFAAKLLFFTVGITFFFSFVKISYNSVVIAHEKMTFYAYTGIIEAIIKLLIVYYLEIIPMDKLVAYGFLQTITTFFFVLIYYIYVKKSLHTHTFLSWDKTLMKELNSFSGWSLYDGLAAIGKVEFVNFIINGFFGVLLNAAIGIAKQINSAVNSFTSNFQVAFRPQLTKCYACKDFYRLQYLITNTSIFSGVIFAMVAVPLCVNIQTILHLWLGSVPEYSPIFAIFFIFSSGLESVGGPLWITAHAIGNIRNFQIVTGTFRLLPILFIYLYLKAGGTVEYVFTLLVLSDLSIYIYRVNYIRKKITFKVNEYLNQLFRLIIIVSVSLLLIIMAANQIKNSIHCLILTTLLSFLLFVVFTYILLMNQSQKKSVKQYIKFYLNKK